MKLIGSAINGGVINLFNIMYGRLALFFTDLENHKYARTYDNNLIRKTFLFQFVNSYIAILWAIVVKQVEH